MRTSCAFLARKISKKAPFMTKTGDRRRKANQTPLLKMSIAGGGDLPPPTVFIILFQLMEWCRMKRSALYST